MHTYFCHFKFYLNSSSLTYGVVLVSDVFLYLNDHGYYNFQTDYDFIFFQQISLKHAKCIKSKVKSTFTRK